MSVIAPDAKGKLPSAVIYGCAGKSLSAEEKAFFNAQNPLGFILFARNIETPAQVKALVDELKATVSHRTPLVLIDQEGGRVARLRPPHWRAYPPARKLAELDRNDEAVYLNSRLIADELSALGINVDCLPLADVPQEGSHDIIGDRAYGLDAFTVSTLARHGAQGLLDSGILPVLKHIPGHGRAMVDSHEDLPVVDAPLEELERVDFEPFRALSDLPLGMTAHVLYTALDSERVATVSPVAIRYIREKIGFDGLLMTDDLSMKALKGDFAQLTRDALAAGCDVVLHCNGKMEEMAAIASAIRPLDKEGLRRAGRLDALLAVAEPFDVADALAEMQHITGALA